MEKDWKAKYLKHLERVSREIKQVEKNLRENPEDFINFEQGLYFAIRGVDPRKAICAKHHQKLSKNDFGEFICSDCIEEFIANKIKEFDDNLYFNPDDKPEMVIRGIKYGMS